VDYAIPFIVASYRSFLNKEPTHTISARVTMDASISSQSHSAVFRWMRINHESKRSLEISLEGPARENSMSNVTEVLADFAASLQFEDLPRSVRDRCKNILLDTLACAVAGHRGEETQQVAALASELAQSNESSPQEAAVILMVQS
jgi:MmgE/PrpD N-terminal domain